MTDPEDAADAPAEPTAGPTATAEPEISAAEVASAEPDVSEIAATGPAEPDTLAVLARDLRGPVLGNPRQLLTGLLIVMLVVIGLLVGLTALSRQL